MSRRHGAGRHARYAIAFKSNEAFIEANLAFLMQILQSIRRVFGNIASFLLRPFVWSRNWYARRGWIIRAFLGAVIVIFVFLYGYFFWTTQWWSNFNPDYAVAYAAASGSKNSESAPGSCKRSVIVDATADLVDFNVNQNAWVSSMILYKLGLFGIDWDDTPFFDNKAAFQRGINQTVRRTAVELVDTLGRVRGTSQIDASLQKARGKIQFDESVWYFAFSPFGPTTPTPSFYRSAIKDLRAFNDRLAKCEALFDTRPDNLRQFIDRIASDIGATSAILKDRAEQNNSGWFDMRADDRFWFAYGQLYGYYGILSAVQVDFHDVIAQRGLAHLWAILLEQLRTSLNIQPFIVSNGAEAGWLMPSHLTTMGFYILRVRSNLIEIRQILDR
jgi:hypothetical protein